MRKSVVLPGAAVTLAAAALLLPLRGQEAAAQQAQAFVNVVDLEISPASMPRFLAALKEDGTATIKEAGTQEFVSSIGQKDKNHVFIFEVFNDAAAWDAHQKTTTYAKFLGITMMMIKTYAIRPFATVMRRMAMMIQCQNEIPLMVLSTDGRPGATSEPEQPRSSPSHVSRSRQRPKWVRSTYRRAKQRASPLWINRQSEAGWIGGIERGFVASRRLT